MFDVNFFSPSPEYHDRPRAPRRVFENDTPCFYGPADPRLRRSNPSYDVYHDSACTASCGKSSPDPLDCVPKWRDVVRLLLLRRVRSASNGFGRSCYARWYSVFGRVFACATDAPGGHWYSGASVPTPRAIVRRLDDNPADRIKKKKEKKIHLGTRLWFRTEFCVLRTISTAGR